MKNKDSIDFSIEAFPEEIDHENSISIYGKESYRNLIAELTHNLHNLIPQSNQVMPKDQIERNAMLIHDYLDYNDRLEDYTDEEIFHVAESPLQYDLFQDFFQVPFPSPQRYNHTFIDLFAGIGGIRIPFDEMGYQCVFSSEWDIKGLSGYLMGVSINLSHSEKEELFINNTSQ